MGKGNLGETDWPPRRLYHSARSTHALILSLVALLVAIIALVVVSMRGSAKDPRDGYPQRYRAVLLPTLPDEPSAQDIMGPSAQNESEQAGAAYRSDHGEAHTEAPWYGLCAPRSVASLDDFRRIVSHDQRLTAYYGGFNWARAQLVTTATPRLVYVSYQKAGAFARTKHPMLLPKGDTLLTDGVIQARTYCCNEVFELVDAPPPPPSTSDQSASPLSPSTPALWPPASSPSFAPPAGTTPPSARAAPPVVPPFSPPFARREVPPLLLPSPPMVLTFAPPPSRGGISPPAFVPPPAGPTFSPLPDFFPGQVPIPPLPSPLVSPPTVMIVPEPSTNILLGLGLAGVVWYHWRARQRARRVALRSPRMPVQ